MLGQVSPGPPPEGCIASFVEASLTEVKKSLVSEHHDILAVHLQNLKIRLVSHFETVSGGRSGKIEYPSQAWLPSGGGQEDMTEYPIMRSSIPGIADDEAAVGAVSSQSSNIVGVQRFTSEQVDDCSKSPTRQMSLPNRDVSGTTFSAPSLTSSSEPVVSARSSLQVPTPDSGGDDDRSVASKTERSEDSDEENESNCSHVKGYFQTLDIWTKMVVAQGKSLRHSPSRSASGQGSQLVDNGLDNAMRSVMSDASMASMFSDGGEIEPVSGYRQFWNISLDRLMIPPSSKRYLFWECFGVTAIVYDLIWVPMQFMDPPKTQFTTVFSWAVRLFWTLNIFVSCLMGYMDHKGTDVMELRLVVYRYATSWLSFDILTVVVDWCDILIDTNNAAGTFSAERAAGLLIIIRLLRILRLQRFRHIIKDIRSESVHLFLTIMKIILIMLFLCHFIACMWFGIGMYGTYQTSWVKFNDVIDLPYLEQYVWSFHCAISLLSGEHAIEPRSSPEKAFCTCVLFVALLFTAWFVSSLTTAMTKINIIASQKSSQFSALKRYLTDNRISRELAAKVQRNALYALNEQKRNAPESSIELLLIISHPLRSELHFEVHSPFLMHHPFFRCYSELQAIALRKVCHYAVSRMSFGGGDIVFTEGEAPAVPKMYIVSKGTLVYTQNSHVTGSVKYPSTGAKVVPVEKADWLSEAVLWTDWSHIGTLTAKADVQLLALEAVKFQGIAIKFPCSQIKNYAVEFVELLSSTRESDLSDLGTRASDDPSFLVKIAFPDQAWMHGGRASRLGSTRRISLRPATINALANMSGGESSRGSNVSLHGETLSPSNSGAPSSRMGRRPSTQSATSMTSGVLVHGVMSSMVHGHRASGRLSLTPSRLSQGSSSGGEIPSLRTMGR